MSNDVSRLFASLLAQSSDSREDEHYLRLCLPVEDAQLTEIKEFAATLEQYNCPTRWAVTSTDTFEEAHELNEPNISGTERTIIVKKTKPNEESVRFFQLESLCTWAATQTDKMECIKVAYIVDLRHSFSTGTCIFVDWVSDVPVKLSELGDIYVNPRRIVRASNSILCPSSVRAWAPDDCNEVPEKFAHLCVTYLARCLAPELREENRALSVFIRGARAHEVKFERSTGSVDRKLLSQLVAATNWIFRSEKEAELRHGLLASEIAREWAPDTKWLVGLSERLHFAPKNAETAYSLHLHELGSDALEQMGMLRRALSDDAGRLSALMSSIQSAIWRDTALGAGFIVIRLSGTDVPSIATLAVIAYLIVSFIVNLLNILGVASLVASDDGRTRNRLYHFVQPDDFREIYSDPVARVKCKLWMVFTLSGFVSLILAVLIIFAAGWMNFEPATADAGSNEPQSQSSNMKSD